MTGSAKLTEAEASAIVDAVLGDDEPNVFATSPMRSGDVALVVRAHGGIEICTLLDADADAVAVESMGMRGLFALALFALANDRELVSRMVLAVHQSSGLDANSNLFSN